jgi:hypothetical protein
MSAPTNTVLRRAYFHDMKRPVQVDIPRARAVAAKNIFVGSGLGACEAGVGARDFGDSDLGISVFGPSIFAGVGGAAFRGARYRVPFLCNCERWVRMAGGTYELPRLVSWRPNICRPPVMAKKRIVGAKNTPM